MENEMFHLDYEVTDNCHNIDSYGEICVKCGQCGREFQGGIMTQTEDGEKIVADEVKEFIEFLVQTRKPCRVKNNGN